MDVLRHIAGVERVLVTKDALHSLYEKKTWGVAPRADQVVGPRHARFRDFIFCSLRVAVGPAHARARDPYTPILGEGQACMSNQKPKRKMGFMTLFYAQPYDVSASGFYFETEEDFASRIVSVKNDHGEPVEELENRFIDGDSIDADLCNAIGVYQNTVCKVLELLEALHEYDEQRLIIACAERGCSFGPDKNDVGDYEKDINCKTLDLI